MRLDPPHNRQPALLQRSSQSDQQGPAEPSAAFQTSRTSEQHLPYGRRRGSSNVSGGSGSYQHLRPKNLEQPFHPGDFGGARRPSLTGETDSPTSPSNFSAGGHPGQRHQGSQPWTRSSPAATHASPYQAAAVPADGRSPNQPPAQTPGGSVTEQDYETQKRVMRLARESAMKRRLEEEAREEAAKKKKKKERIRLKLEAMGPAPESNSAKKTAAKTHPTPDEIQSRQDSNLSTSRDDQKCFRGERFGRAI